jgi:hypothetical protein
MTEYRHASIHDFKTHISRYISDLEQGLYKGVVVRRRAKPVGIFALINRTKSAAEPPSENAGIVLDRPDEGSSEG